MTKKIALVGAGATSRCVLKNFLIFSPDDGDPVIPHLFVGGRNPLVVIVGSNAAGKSVFRRLVEDHYRKQKVECISISMFGRCQGSFGGMRGFVYGDESWNATGVNSAHTVLTGIKTCQGRTQPHMMCWDEPDIGMAEEGAAGMGLAIKKFASKPSKHTKGIFVITHSRHLAKQLLPARPHYLHLGIDPSKAPPTLKDWVEREIVPADLRQLVDDGHARFKAIQKFLKE